jgi:hypothetical protein
MLLFKMSPTFSLFPEAFIIPRFSLRRFFDLAASMCAFTTALKLFASPLKRKKRAATPSRIFRKKMRDEKFLSGRFLYNR